MKPLNTIGKKFSEAGRALACLDVNKSQCLKKVMESKRLVDWLRTTIKCKYSQRTYSVKSTLTQFLE